MTLVTCSTLSMYLCVCGFLFFIFCEAHIKKGTSEEDGMFVVCRSDAMIKRGTKPFVLLFGGVVRCVCGRRAGMLEGNSSREGASGRVEREREVS